ncbi:MAG: DNRLRE domain-containing protein, partial [Chloroflexi bacterium]|nr:DNRLRE domain-containing protein [Chloroflexota bacterium]
MHLTASYTHKRLALLISLGLLLALILTGLQRVQAESVPHAGDANTQGTIVADSYVSEGSPTTNFGNSGNLYVGHDEFEQESYSLVRFNLPTLPAGAVI